MFAKYHLTQRIGTVAALLLAVSFGAVSGRADTTDSIRPYAANPYYWQYKGEPVLLLGGSWQDNEAYCMAQPGQQYAVYFVVHTSTKRKRVNKLRSNTLARAACLYSPQIHAKVALSN